MYCAGSTIGPARKPFMRIDGKRKMLPRPYRACLFGNSGYHFMKRTWVIEFFKCIEAMALHFLTFHYKHCPDNNRILSNILLSKKIVPNDLRICDTFFTQLSVVGDMSFLNCSAKINPHVDKDDIFSAIIHFGKIDSGGDLLFFKNKDTNIKGNLNHVVKFKHGMVHFGSFHSIYHAVDPWKGSRGSMVLNVKSSMIDHFSKQGNIYYNTYKHCKYPKDDYFIVN